MTWKFDLLLNIIAEIIGVILSVIVVYLLIERFLEKREKKRWESVRGRIYSRILDATFLFFHYALYTRQKSFSRKIPKPEEHEKILKKDIHKWQFVDYTMYGDGLKKFKKEMERILDIYQTQIPPEILENLLEIEGEIKILLSDMEAIVMPKSEGHFERLKEYESEWIDDHVKRMILFYNLVFGLSSKVTKLEIEVQTPILRYFLD